MINNKVLGIKPAILLALYMISFLQIRGEVRFVDTKECFGVENEIFVLAFNKRTGALDSLFNKITKDNYIKKFNGGNLFRIYKDTEKMPDLISGPHNNSYGGVIIEPFNCQVINYYYDSKGSASILCILYKHNEINGEIKLTITLTKESCWFDADLEVININSDMFSMYAAFPYITGVSLGNNGNTNLAVNAWDRGYPGIKAWEKNTGGVYGRDVAMQWQCVYEPELKEGLAFIVKDTLFTNKILTCFPGGGMTSLFLDEKRICKGDQKKWPSVRILIYNGNWRIAAKEYGKWFSENVGFRPIPKSYKENVTTRAGGWIPKKEIIDDFKKSGNPKLFKSFLQLHNLYNGSFSDCTEWAMWNEGVNLWPETYGPWMSSGFIGFRSDLGGLKAFEKGINDIHNFGKKVAIYVAGYGARKTSPIYNGKWEKFAVMDESGEYNMEYKSASEEFGPFNCVGYEGWQDNLVRICTMLAKAGVDEIRIDEFGFPFRPCFNPVHKHERPYNSNQWMLATLKKIREATDKINPDLFISTEFFMDFFHKYTNGALVMDCPGKEIDVMKVAMPDYIPLSYHAGASEAAITGALVNKLNNLRTNWAWEHVGISKPEDFDENFKVDFMWHVLQPTFKDAVMYGEVTEWDPVAINDSKWVGHLWKSRDYWMLTGGHFDGSDLSNSSVKVKLPELPEDIVHAYEFNVKNLKLKEIQILRTENEIFLQLKSPVSAVFFPLPSCPALPIVNQRDKAITKGDSLTVEISLFSPWNKTERVKRLSSVNLIAPGFRVTKTKTSKKICFTIHTTKRISENDYFFEISGNCLKAKRWFTVK